MGKAAQSEIPQIIAIVSVPANGRISLKKAVRQHLGLQNGQPLFLHIGDEITLSSDPQGATVALGKGNRITLPEDVLARLDISTGTRVGLVQRPNAVAVKRVDIVEQRSERACLLDVETPRTITRRVETNPMPGELLPALKAQHADMALRYDVFGFLTGQQTLAAWQARRLLGRPAPGDEGLRQALIAERLEDQSENGSWHDHLLLTARNLRELADLGLTGEDANTQRAIAWLVERPQSEHNPGMFFATDELVTEQAQVVERRQGGIRDRFRQLKTSEKKRVMAGDDLICAPCGPRIMWPNALVLEALLRLGYEDQPRVQTALRTMTAHDWCECAYQHGVSDWRSSGPLTIDQIAQFEQTCIAQYRYGGISDLQELAQADMSHAPFRLPRVAHTRTDGADEYPLEMPEHTQGCEAITTRAMSRIRDARVRRFAQAHLWRFAGKQRGPKGEFAPESYGSGFSQAGFLYLFACYDHPASKVVVMRALPWIVDAQNEDGSWGEDHNADASTLAVVTALLSLGDLAPPGMVPTECSHPAPPAKRGESKPSS
jgi:bifunctional DNA-binding transcriptional regulator/antitoxin component of YhaV-PrlF toxin-antitoxin module